MFSPFFLGRLLLRTSLLTRALVAVSCIAVCAAQAEPRQTPAKSKSKPVAKTQPAAKSQAKAQLATPVPGAPQLPTSSARKAERLYYQEAQKALAKKQLSRYQLILPKLKNYPLLPYLEYQELSERLMALPRADVDKFFARHPDSFVGERLLHRWLRTLAIKELWTEYRRYYNSNLTDPELACLNLRARLATGDKAALKEVEPLWNIGRPQSKSCDPVFAEWRKQGMRTPALLWSRHAKAVKADEIDLAINLAHEMEPEQQKLAVQYENVAQNPRLILQTDNFSTNSPEARSSIILGLEGYAQTSATEALHLWQIYASRGHFNESERSQVNYSIARQLLRQEQGALAERLVADSPGLSQPDLLESLIREALRRQDWEKSLHWILRLPAESRASERWSYWLARVTEELKMQEAGGKTPGELYTQVAGTRSFYGFLASDRLGRPYSLRDYPLTISKEVMSKVETTPGIERAREFYSLGDYAAATREWVYTTHKFDSTEKMVAAGRIADRWGWYRQAIQTMQDSEYMDDLAVRFPIPFHENVKAAARQAEVDPHFVFAITKQESAFNTEAKSPVGALGLMQLMPTTARATAKKAGLTFNQQDLLRADKNIVLGANYLNELLDRFSGNRILVAAAYNAGPTRVRQWLGKDGEKLPYDVWIETIPYKETRLYVQNILSFAVIYGYRTGSKQSFLTPQELAQQL
jgi:soluble lytic murein transglycosylase